MGFEALRLPHLKFFAKTDEGDVAGDAGVLAQALRKDRASILVNAEDFAGAEQRGGELVLLVGIRSEVFDQRMNLVDKTLAAGVECGRVERRITVDAVEAVFGEDSAERSRDRNAAFGVDLVGKGRDKLVHLPLTHPSRRGTSSKLEVQPMPENGGRGGADPPVASKERGQPLPLTHRTGNDGITWDFMGVNGMHWSETP